MEKIKNNYAIIVSGSKQYRVSEGDVIEVEQLNSESEKVGFDKVLMVRTEAEAEIGTPYLDNRRVEGKVLCEKRGKKIHGIKFKRRKGYLRRYGHRQNYTQVEITRIA